MEAYELAIDSKTKSHAFRVVSPSDFGVRQGRSVDPRVVLESPTLSLYCLDHERRRAVFVETPPDAEMLQAPFFFIAQYEAATRLVAVPYDTLHALADDVSLDPKRIILVYSTGRCGSTLVSRVLNQSPGVVSYSEPDVFTQLVMLRTAGHASDVEVATLLRDCVMVMGANAAQQGFRSWAFKFRSYVASLADLFYQAVPEARLVFLYRNALSWARSFSHSFGITDAELAEHLGQRGGRYLVPSANALLETPASRLSWVEWLAHMWVSAMQAGRWLVERQAPLACARFEDLKTAPRPVAESLLLHCGLPLPAPERFAEVLATDSQEGTTAARAGKPPARQLTDADLARLDQLIRKLDAALTADTALP